MRRILSRAFRKTQRIVINTSLATIVAVSSLFAATPLFLSQTAYAAGGTLYVNTSAGDDSNDCTSPASACSTIGGAIGKATSGDSIFVAAGTYDLTQELDINMPLTISGQGTVTIKSNNPSWDTTNSGKHIIGIYSGTSTGPVTISNVTIDSNSQSYGVNTYNNGYGVLNNVTIQNSKGAGLTVNGSTIVATDLNTSGNSWGAVNVDPGSGVTTPSVFTLNSGTLSESNQIWSDGLNVTGSATVTVNAPGYNMYKVGGTTAGELWTDQSLTNAVTITSGATTTLYPSVQAAVDSASPGDTINIAPGTYASGFTVNGKDNLTIAGSGVSSTIIAPATLVDSGTQHKYTSDMKVSVFVNNSTNITIENMKITDNGSAPGLGGPDALVFWNGSTGTLSDDSITATYTINGIQTGQGIAIDGSSGTTSLNVANATISGFQKNGIDVIDGNGATSGATDTTILTVTGTTITGAGPTSAIGQNGIVLWDRGGGNISGSVSNSSITGLQYTPLDLASGNNGTGILTYGTAASVTVSNSSLTDSDLDAANATSSGTFAATDNYWGSSGPDFTSIIGQTSDGYGSVSYLPYYLDSNRTALSSADDLTSLSLSAGTLSPAFSTSTTNYSTTVANSISSITPSYAASTDANVSVSSNAGNLSVGSNVVTISVASADGTATKTYTVTVNRAAATQTLPDSSGNATLNNSTPQVVVTSGTQSLNITVSSGTSNATINYSALKTSSTTAVVPQTTINTQGATVQIQAGTTITASGGWDGTITAPTVQSAASVSIPTATGTINTIGTVIEVGSSSISLTFDQAVRLLIPGQAGKLVGFMRSGNFTQISTACSADSQAVGNALPAGGDCYISVGGDMVVWTKHFTTFVTYAVSNKYIVQPGDTFFSIAQRVGLTLAQLEALNPTAGHPAGYFDLILPGDVLSIGGAVVRTASTSAGGGSTPSNSSSTGVLGQNTTGGQVGSAASATKNKAPAVAASTTANTAMKWYWWLAIVAAVLVALTAVGAYGQTASRKKK